MACVLLGSWGNVRRTRPGPVRNTGREYAGKTAKSQGRIAPFAAFARLASAGADVVSSAAFSALRFPSMPPKRRKTSESPSVRRMPSYLDWLLRMRGLGKRTVSTTELADGMKLGWTVVRKDVALVGTANPSDFSSPA